MSAKIYREYAFQPSAIKLLMCPPTYLSTDIPNNAWMLAYPPEERKVDRAKAMEQWMNLYAQMVNAGALVYLVPPKEGLQDQVYTANVCARLHHTKNTVIVSNFRAEGRAGEATEARKILEQMGYTCWWLPYYFEGEAELRWLRENIYLGGYGVRAEKKALETIEKNFNCKIIKIPETEWLYHIDCRVFPIDSYTVVADESIPKDILGEIEKYAEVIKVPQKLCEQGLTNSVRIGYTVFNATHISELKPDTKEYRWEKKKNEALEKICRDLSLELVFLNMSEFLKSGALLSCCIAFLENEGLECKPWKNG